MKKLSLSTLALFLFLSAFAQNYNITFRSKISFPGQTVANMCGWASPDGKEYALVGASKGMVIVDVTNPDAPQQIVQIPGPDNFWKEIKTYGNYAYIVTEGGSGVQIVDLSALPSSTLPSKYYKGDGAIVNQLNAIHALHIDVTKGYLYAYGSNLFNGGAVVLDLKPDPWTPKYVGKFDQLGYIHDGYVDNDTLYASHINAGLFSIVNMTNKAAPELINTQSTPTLFTHNTWLSEDRKTIFTTDETGDSFLGAYDVSDPTDVQFLDKFQTAPGSGSIVHNTHIRGKYAITAWYTEGVNIVDVTRPENLVETGKYDTYPQGSGGSFDGCWGVYPYLPSGNLVVSNITPGELWILTPSYQRACYLEGKITDASTGASISGALVLFNGNNTSGKQSKNDGTYGIGQLTPGLANVQVTKFGYLPASAQVNLITGEIVQQDFALTPSQSYSVSGIIRRADNAAPIPGGQIAVLSPDISYNLVADANGAFAIPSVVGGLYDVVAGAWGYRYEIQNLSINGNQQLVLELTEGYQDDFVFDYGWESSGTSATGKWERTSQPLEINVGVVVAPGADVPGDVGFSCFVTGNSSNEIDLDDVESGTSILTSPIMDLSNYLNPRITGKVWCVSANINQQFVDSVKVYISNGIQEKLAWKRKGNVFDWQNLSFDVTDFVPLTDQMRIRIVSFDNPNTTIFDTHEAAFDQFNVSDQPLATSDPESVITLNASPNPFYDQTLIRYEHADTDARLEVFDLSGRMRASYPLTDHEGTVLLGGSLPPGVYLVKLHQIEGYSAPLKIVKVR
ncbi:MAG TPA: hypothetical protein DCF33_04170 [Saprospirales bacterium]|nr:hypothetical protein [Saprospirales bacterium]